MSGRVQGVAYRASAVEAAAGLRGWISNRADGSVEGVVEGPDGSVSRFLAWCARGPHGARVQGVEHDLDEGTDPLGPFAIRR